MHIVKLKLRDSSHSQLLKLSGKCENCIKYNVGYVTNEFREGHNDSMSLTAHFTKSLFINTAMCHVP